MENNPQINYTAIHFKNNTDLIPFNEFWYVYVLTGVSVLIGIIFFSGGIAFVVPLIIATTFLGKKIAEKRKKAFKKFAEDNGWQLTSEDGLALAPLGVRWFGRASKYTDVIVGSYSGNHFYLYEYAYTIGSGKSSKRVNLTVMELELDKYFPYVLLDSKKNRGGAQRIIKGSERLSLEGDFDSNFSMFVEKGHHIDGLAIITPDVMRTSMQATANYDIEIYRNKLYLYVEGDRRNRTYIEDLFKGVSAIMKEINHKAKSVKYASAMNEITEKDLELLADKYSEISVGGYDVPLLKILRVGFIIIFVIFFIYMFGSILNVFWEVSRYL